MRFALSLAVLLVAGAATAAAPSFLFDVLRQHAYRASWDKLMKEMEQAEPMPDWLMHFSRNFDGAASEMVEVTVDGKSYERAYVCKPTDCAGRKFEVIFEAGGARAYGAFGGKDSPPDFFGAPGPALQEALANAIKG
jgi:hypothetical protein